MSTRPNISINQQLDTATSSFQAGLFSQASDAVREVLILDPQNVQARLLEARIELARNRSGAALVALDAYDLNNPDSHQSPELALMRSEALCRAGHVQMSRDLLEKLVVQYPDDVRPHQLMASICLALGNQAQAIEPLRHVVRLCPSDKSSMRQLVDLLVRHAPEEAVVLVESMLPANLETLDTSDTSHTTAVFLQLARLYHSLERDRDAEDIYRRLLIHHPDEAGLWLDAGRLADQMGAADLAITRLIQVHRLTGAGQAPVLQALATAHMRAGLLSRAGYFWWQLCRTGQLEHQVESTAGLLVCALALGRKRIVRAAHHQLATRASRHDRRKAVMRLWAQAAGGIVVAEQLGKPPRATHSTAVTVLGPLVSRAMDTLKAHVVQHPNRADSHYHLAMCQQASGESDDAWHSVTRALEINPRYITAAKLYAQLQVTKRQRLAA